jgi:hypothetical protein
VAEKRLQTQTKIGVKYQSMPLGCDKHCEHIVVRINTGFIFVSNQFTVLFYCSVSSYHVILVLLSDCMLISVGI